MVASNEENIPRNRRRFTNEVAEQIRLLHSSGGVSFRELVEKFEVSKSTMSRLLRGDKTYKIKK